MNKKIIFILLIIVVFFTCGIFFWKNTGTSSDLIHPTIKYLGWAFALGTISAISLPMGSLAGIIFKPRASVTAAFTAFGAGALLAALSIELIAPTVMEIVGQTENPLGMSHEKSNAIFNMSALIFGCILGGLLFYFLDEAVNSQGGFIRKISTILTFLKKDDGAKVVREMENNDLHPVDTDEVKKEAKEHHSGPMAIWLGLLIDGIPESFVIGSGFLAILTSKLSAGISPDFADVIPYTLVAGLFLSNFPEALGSSIGMKKQGMSIKKILFLWSSLVLVIGTGSMLGYYLGAEVPHEVEIGIEGLAAGAMLTMIAQTMIPEAVHIGGSKVVGLSTLIGYLSATAFKLFE